MEEQDLVYATSGWWVHGGGSTRRGGEVLGLQRAHPDVHTVHVCVPASGVGTGNS